MTGRAVISPDGRYRYVLERLFDPTLGTADRCCTFVMLNPSTADALQDDPTIRRCVRYAQDWGFSALAVVNLFGYRATQPSELYDVHLTDPVGPDNDYWIRQTVNGSDLTVCAWGHHGRHLDRDRAVMALLEDCGARPTALQLTKDGLPCHPLYLPASLSPEPYGGRP